MPADEFIEKALLYQHKFQLSLAHAEPTSRSTMSNILKSIGSTVARLLRRHEATAFPQSTPHIESWKSALAVPEEKFGVRLMELAVEAQTRTNAYKVKQKRASLAAGKRKHGRNGGSLAKKRAKTAHSMLMAKGRFAHAANRAKSLNGGRA